ncbi:MAG: lipoate--protein ligase [Bacteroidales bacterium]|nr:lipoate--protein ligase [Bacteroidales bacterium]MBP5796142.1 lipoate--protein ligase [Bacteroidales bacterium]
MKFLRNPSTDPHFNMSFDEYCLQRLPSDDDVFYLWQNRPSVIIGHNQDAAREVNLEYLERNGIVLARRVTGGGAVYHDLQNLNYSIVGRKPRIEVIVEALRSLGVPAELTGRNDIFVEGRKVSGFARSVYHQRELIHGTLMYDVDIDTLTRALDTPESKLNRKGVASVRSRVTNLKDYLPGIEDIYQFRDRLHALLACGDPEINLGPEAMDAIEKRRIEKFAAPEWIYGISGTPVPEFL